MHIYTTTAYRHAPSSVKYYIRGSWVVDTSPRWVGYYSFICSFIHSPLYSLVRQFGMEGIRMHKGATGTGVWGPTRVVLWSLVNLCMANTRFVVMPPLTYTSKPKKRTRGLRERLVLLRLPMLFLFHHLPRRLDLLDLWQLGGQGEASPGRHHRWCVHLRASCINQDGQEAEFSCVACQRRTWLC